MKVIFLLRTLDPSSGGIQRVTSLVAAGLQEYGIESFFAYIDECETKIPIAKRIRLNISHFSFPSEGEFFSFVTENKIDYIVNQDLYLYPLLNSLKKIKQETNCKIVNYFHVSPNFFLFDRRPKILIFDFLFKIFFRVPYHVRSRSLMYDIADRYVLLSSQFKESFLKLYNIKNDKKLFFIPDPLTFSSIASLDVLKNKKKQVLILTRFCERQKNICSALRIWKKIEKKNPKLDWNLVLGGYGEDEKKILEYAKKLKLKKINFVGKVNNAEAYFEDSAIFMMTSKFEGFGMTLTEAQQKACVPIAFNSFPVLNEIISDGENGFVVENMDEEDYALRLNCLMKNSAMRQEMAKKCLSLVCKYHWNNVVKKWIKLFGVNDERR